ncbi:MAG: D-alanyl-D-alanine carboxypeptidase family protein [Candidatus Aquicultor sp.]|nr:D-alanyl-D-alanine carboxypeptidase family protein [Candidatus Aquicultor sp.]
MNRRAVKTLILAIILVVAAPFQSGAFAATDPTTSALKIKAPAAILIDEKTGEVLWEKNADEKRAAASTTKIMTAILALEREEMDDTITVGEEVAAAGPYGIKLSVGEQLALQDLLYALMLSSANDSALVIADHIGGDVGKFIDLMNTKATRIGAFNTHYANPHGLSDKTQYTTARDLARIARYGLNNEDFKTIVSTTEWKLNRSDPKKLTVVENRNKLLGIYPLATGIKTGYISEAGYCLVSSAETDTVSVIAVVLGASSYKRLFNESQQVLDYGFSLYEKKKLITKGHKHRMVALKYGEELDLVAKDDVEANVRRILDTSTTISLESDIDYPINKGQVLGKIKVNQAGRKVASTDLVAERSIEKPGFGKIARFYLDRLWKSIF